MIGHISSFICKLDNVDDLNPVEESCFLSTQNENVKRLYAFKGTHDIDDCCIYNCRDGAITKSLKFTPACLQLNMRATTITCSNSTTSETPSENYFILVSLDSLTYVLNP